MSSLAAAPVITFAPIASADLRDQADAEQAVWLVPH
jgi:hypothetical protein